MCEAVAIAGLVLMAAGTAYGAYSSYEQGKAQKEANDAQAKALLEQSRLQQEEYLRQSRLAEERAGIAQVQGEQEAANRSRQLAAAIGSAYADWAGNGLLVDGGGVDTLDSVLTAQVTEAQADISTIRDNAAIATWNHMEDKRSYLAQMKYEGMSARNQASALRTAGALAYRAGVNGAIGTGLKGAGGLATGAAGIATTYGTFGAGAAVDSTNTLNGGRNVLTGSGMKTSLYA